MKIFKRPIKNLIIIASVIIMVFTGAIIVFVEVLPFAVRPSKYILEKGEVASQDIQAPFSISFVSKSLTEKAKIESEASVSPVYLPANPEISRHQIERLRINLNYISNVRSDNHASVEQKFSDLAALQDIRISNITTQQILGLDDIRWLTIQQETLRVLEQAMRNTIREDRLREAQRNIPTLVSFALPVGLTSVVIELVTPFVIPNSLYSDELTKKARDDILNSIKPVTKTYIFGEIIVEKGRILTEEDMEALQEFGLVQPQNNSSRVFSISILVTLLCVLIIIYFYRKGENFLPDIRSQITISIIFIGFLFGARYLFPNTTVIPYIYPLSAFSMTIACLLNSEISLIFSFCLSLLSAFGIDEHPDLTLYLLFTCFSGVLFLGKGQRIANFFWSGIAVGVSGCSVILVSRISDPNTDIVGIATLFGGAVINGLAAASLALLLQFLLANLLELTTPLRLLDISRPNHPLLRLILTNAPGTYQHSLQVANLAEQAAEVIGADTMLVRVGALYHDAGKATNPLYYIENQIPGTKNPHDNMDPVVSSATIIQHVYDGITLANKFRLPKRIKDFILEHHGSMLTRYQYSKAVEANGNKADNIDKDLFRYPGPAPLSKETALLMLADGCEAKARAEHPAGIPEIRLLVKGIVDYLLREGQFDNTSLNFRDLHLVTESFVSTLQNTHHPRLQYPELGQINFSNGEIEKTTNSKTPPDEGSNT